MGKAVKGIAKIFKGVTKVVKKVVKGIAGVGKKIINGIGKVMGKLGPIGTLAIGFIAPYALPAMAGSGVGWVSAIGKGLQAVSSAVAAPFKIAGQAIGKGISTFGGSVGQAIGGSMGQGITTLTDKVSGFLGYTGGSVSEGAAGIMDSVKGQWNEAFGTDFTTSVAKTNVTTPGVDFGEVKFGTSTPASPSSSVSFDAGAGDVSLLDPKGAITTPYDVAIDNTKMGSVYDTARTDGIFDTEGVNPFEKQYSAEELSKIDVTKDPASKFKMPSFGLPTPPASGQVPELANDGYALSSAEAGKSGGPGSRGTSFFAQDRTGLLLTEDFLKQQNSLLGRA